MFFLIPVLLVLAYVVKKSSTKNDFKQKSINHFLVAIVLATTMTVVMLNSTVDINPVLKYTVLGISIIAVAENIISGIRYFRKSDSSML